MKTLTQTITEIGKGNCLATCLACLLDVSAEEVPDLKCGNDFTALVRYLAGKGIAPIWLHCEALSKAYVGYSPEHCILIGPSPRQPGVNHAVVGRPAGYGFEVVHDPHPDGGGLAGPIKSVIYLGAMPCLSEVAN